MRRQLSLAALSLATVASTPAQTPGVDGAWRTPGGAIVRVAPCGDTPSTVCATLIQLEPNSPFHLDANNPDPAKRSQKLCGLLIGYGFHLASPTHAEDGHLYDPKSGKTYKGAMSANGNTLDLRGYIGIKAFGRTETWTRTTPVPTCT